MSTTEDETDAETEAEEETVPVTWEGEMKEGWIPDKEGTATFPNGDIYVGNYENGKKNGKGKYTWVKGGIYEGQYSNDQRNGTGIMKYPDKSIYSGAWFRSKRHGEGIYTYRNGDRYQGEWREDLKHGQGTYYFVESMSSVRQFNDNSKFSMTYILYVAFSSKVPKEKFVGTWELGSFISGEWVWRDGNTYEGNFFEDRPIGQGKYKFRNTNNELEGQFVRIELPPDPSKLPPPPPKKRKRRKSKKPPGLPPPIVKLEFKYVQLRTRPVRNTYY